MMASPRWTFLVALFCVFVGVTAFGRVPAAQQDRPGGGTS